MTWLIVGLLLLAAFGPIVWLIPSRRERRIAAMRTHARRVGLVVQMTPIRKRDATPSERVTAAGTPKTPTILCAAYRLPFPKPIRYLPTWKADRDAAGDRGPADGWVWDSAPTGPEASSLAPVWQLLTALPADALSVEATRLDVACWWREQAPDGDGETAVNSLLKALREIADALVELNERVEVRIADEAADD